MLPTVIHAQVIIRTYSKLIHATDDQLELSAARGRLSPCFVTLHR